MLGQLVEGPHIAAHPEGTTSSRCALCADTVACVAPFDVLIAAVQKQGVVVMSPGKPDNPKPDHPQHPDVPKGPPSHTPGRPDGPPVPSNPPPHRPVA